MSRIFEDVPVRKWIASVLIVVVLFVVANLYLRFAQPPKITISPANFAGEVVIWANKGNNLRIFDGIVDRGTISQSITRLILSDGNHQVMVTQGEKILTQKIVAVDREPVKKVEVYQENPWSLHIEISANDQVAAVYVNGQAAKNKDGVFSISFPLWTIWSWEDETLNLRIEDREGNGGVYPLIPLSQYLPADRLELRDSNERLWGIAEEKPFWWDFLPTFKVESYLGKKLVSTQAVAWDETILLAIETLIEVIAVASVLMGILFLTNKGVWWLINVGLPKAKRWLKYLYLRIYRRYIRQIQIY